MIKNVNNNISLELDRNYLNLNRIIELNKTIHGNYTDRYEYHMQHIKLSVAYATKLVHRLNISMDLHKLRYSLYAHDLLKDKAFDKNVNEVVIDDLKIPNNLNWYVRSNLDILEKYGLDEYFNTDIQLHPLAAGIFLVKELNMNDPDILYPIFFHSCPIISVYEKLDKHIQDIIDIAMLSDKLSSNHIKQDSKKTICNLNTIVFGEHDNELNYSLGLFIARLISQGNSTEEQSSKTTEYYYNRLLKINPFINKISYKELEKAWVRNK